VAGCGSAGRTFGAAPGQSLAYGGFVTGTILCLFYGGLPLLDCLSGPSAISGFPDRGPLSLAIGLYALSRRRRRAKRRSCTQMLLVRPAFGGPNLAFARIFVLFLLLGLVCFCFWLRAADLLFMRCSSFASLPGAGDALSNVLITAPHGWGLNVRWAPANWWNFAAFRTLRSACFFHSHAFGRTGDALNGTWGFELCNGRLKPAGLSCRGGIRGRLHGNTASRPAFWVGLSSFPVLAWHLACLGKAQSGAGQVNHELAWVRFWIPISLGRGWGLDSELVAFMLGDAAAINSKIFEG